jgi:hypothetical protein
MTQFTSPRPMSLRLNKPRNPIVAPSLLRQAGRHALGNQRQAQRRDLHKQLLQLASSDSSP